MNKLLKVFIGIFFSFSTLFLCIGHAAISGSLLVSGTAQAEPPPGIYIVEEIVTGVNRATAISQSHVSQSTTIMNKVNKTSSSSSGTVTYKITVWNNTPYVYAYSGVEYEKNVTGYNGNSYLGSAGNSRISISTTISAGEIVNPNEKIIFNATYTYGRTVPKGDYSTIVNYKFGVNIDSVGEVAIDEVLLQFGKILNDTQSGGGYETLTDKIDDKFDGNPNNGWKTNFIGNVADSSSADSTTINMLFEGKLKVTIDGTVTNVTLLIKREDVDGNLQTGDSYTSTHPNGGKFSASGCEMTIYMTTDPLTNKYQRPTVYAAVFTCDVNDDGSFGNWYMIGDMFKGTAQIVGYEGGDTTGSFNTEEWRSSASTYDVGAGYSYSVTQGNTIKTVINTRDTKAVTALNTLLNNAKEILDENQYAGQAMISLRNAYEAAANIYTVSENGTVSVKNDTTRAKIVQHIKALEHALSAFEGLQ